MMSDLPASWKATVGTAAAFAALFALLNSLACGGGETEATDATNPDAITHREHITETGMERSSWQALDSESSVQVGVSAIPTS